jgi:hypothetical protein
MMIMTKFKVLLVGIYLVAVALMGEYWNVERARRTHD